MKILVAVELKVKDSPVLVTEVEMKTPKSASDKDRAAFALIDIEDQVIEKSIKVTKYQVRGRHKKLKSIRCPHCKFNYSRDGKDVTELEIDLMKEPDEYKIIRCLQCRKLYSVKKWGDYWEMGW